MASKTARLTTRELTRRTFPDFEQFFRQVHGCACTLYFFGRHLTPVAGTAKERAATLGAPDRSRKHFPHQELMRNRELEAVDGLARKGQAHGILVYANAVLDRGDPDGLSAQRSDGTEAAQDLRLALGMLVTTRCSENALFRRCRRLP